MKPKISIFFVLAALTMGAGIASGQDLKAKYAPILGTYQFDLSSLGIGLQNIEFFMENNKLLTKRERGNDTPELVPVKDKEFEFTINDPGEGLYTITFQKDDKGQYTRCHIVNGGMGIDVVGTKIVK